MRTYFECIPCFFNQALRAAEAAGATPVQRKVIIDAVASRIPQFSMTSTPPEMGRIIYRIIRQVTGLNDPYYDQKKESNRLMLGLYPFFKEKIYESKDGLRTAVLLSILGNIVDYGAKHQLDIDSEIKKFVEQSDYEQKGNTFYYQQFVSQIEKAKSIMVLGDNAGEIVCDRLLIEEIIRCFGKKHIYFAVRGEPVINDVLAEDARECGIDRAATIVANGSDAPGTIIKDCSDEFVSLFKKADLIISKGQGNYETLSDREENIFFLLRAKCPTIAAHLQCAIGDTILTGERIITVL